MSSEIDIVYTELNDFGDAVLLQNGQRKSKKIKGKYSEFMKERNKYIHSTPMRLYFIEDQSLSTNYHHWQGHQFEGNL